LASINIQQYGDKQRLLIIVFMIIGVSGLHLLFPHNFQKSHILARELYFLPIILSAFWFGLRGAVITALAITAFYLIYSALNWRDFSTDDLDRLLEIALYNIVAVTMGILQDRQKARAREKLESVKALAGTVAHEMNSPLFVAIGNLELLQDDFGQDSAPYLAMKNIINNLNQLKNLIIRISQLEEVVTRDYDGTSRIVDLDKSFPADT
jgi:signal transduction histidine kinase